MGTFHDVSTPRTLTLPPGVRREVLHTSRGAFAALTAGPTDSALPTMVLVPGWTGSKEDFATLLPYLAAAGRRAIAFDQRGQYETAGTDDGAAYTLAALATDAMAVASTVSSQPVDLVGHSFGGLVVTQAVLDAPTDVNAAVLLCSGPGALPIDRHADTAALSDALTAIGAAATWDAMRQRERAAGLPAPPPDIEAWMRSRFLRNHPVALAAKTDLLRTAPDRTSDLAARPTPLLVLTTEHDDGWPVEAQVEMGRRAQAEVAVLDGLMHSPAVEDPARTARHLLDFVDRWRPTAWLELTATGSSADVPRVRHALRHRLDPILAPGRLDDAELMTSEVVTNAVVHARPPIHIQARVMGARLVVVVTDSGGRLPQESRADHGRGLAIVASLAERCGAWVDGSGGTAWFWLPTGAESAPPSCQPSGGGTSDSAGGSSAAHGSTGGPMASPSAHDAW